MSDACTVAVVLRDRFSPTENCLKTILEHTPASVTVLAVLSGAPPAVRKRLETVFGSRVQFVFGDRLLNPSESRNTALRLCKTKLAVLMDNDVSVRPGWLEALLQCQKETGAAMVVPVILETPTRVHTAGNDLFITNQNGKAYGQKVLRFAKMTYYEDSNLQRSETAYGELHCQLVDVETALKLGVYDEAFREVAEVDSGLIWAKAGCRMMFEPRSVVYYEFPGRITAVEDIRPFAFKWDMRAISEGYAHFHRKWNLDITECGNWLRYNVILNDKLGLLSRRFPNPASLFFDNFLLDLRKHVNLNGPLSLWRRFKSWVYGYYSWKS